MRKWSRVRLALRVIGAMAGAAAPMAGGIPAGILAAVAVGCTTLSVDLPRDPWPAEKQEAHRRRKTRPNPTIQQGGGNE